MRSLPWVLLSSRYVRKSLQLRFYVIYDVTSVGGLSRTTWNIVLYLHGRSFEPFLEFGMIICAYGHLAKV
eukprot:c36414_g1_i1 orf=81-290(-)